MDQQTNRYRKLRKAWLVRGVGGLLCTGLGLSLFGEAVIRKANNQSWFWLGTLCLVVFNYGLCLLFDSHNYQLQIREKRSLDSNQ